MTDPKYYTPDSWDLTLSRAKYEAKYRRDDNAVWVEFDVDSDNYKDALISDHFDLRVKHLDREDVESLEWEYQKDNDIIELFYDKETRRHSILHNILTHWCVVTLRSEARKEDYTAFAGFIRNKSELKRTMKMVGI